MALPDKKTLRTEMIAARNRIDAETSKAAGVALARHMLEALPRHGIVGGYFSMRGEIGLHETLAELSERGHPLSLPVVTAPDAPLLFRRWRIDHPMVMGKFNVSVPPESEPELVPDIVIVPLVAFDASGHRLGYGAGFYDRTIAALRRNKKNILFAGAAYALQQIAAIPAEPHDGKLDMIVTEKGVIRIP